MLLVMFYILKTYHIWNISPYGGPLAKNWCLEVGQPDSASSRKGESYKVTWLRALAWEVCLKLAIAPFCVSRVDLSYEHYKCL